MSYSVQHNLQLRPFNTFGIRATAHLACTLDDEAAVDEVLGLLREKGAAEVRAPHPHEIRPNEQPFPRPLILSGGSNLLLARDLDEPVLLMRTRGRHVVEQQGDTVWLDVAAGEVWHDTVRWTLQQSYPGLENLALIPGSVGAAPVQNIGAYGLELQDRFHSLDAIALDAGRPLTLDAAQCGFGYRHSIFKQKGNDGLAGCAVITQVRLALPKTWRPELDYADLQRKMAELNQPQPTAQQVFDMVVAIRRAKLPDPTVVGNAGSFFKNPVVSAQQFERLQQEYATIPHFPQADGSIKLAAGWLIDQCNLKDYQIGGAAVHQQQALVLINKGNATASDVVELAHHIYHLVALRFDIQLQPEVRFIGKYGEVDSQQTIS